MKKGFTLIDTLVGVSLVIIVFIGIFGAYQLGLHVVRQAQHRIIATSIANEFIEVARNLPYSDVGVQGGFPTGIFLNPDVVTRNNVQYTVTPDIDFVSDPADGEIPADTCPNDYKRVLFTVSWSGQSSGQVSLATDVAPGNDIQECDVTGGMLRVTVFDALGVPISGADVAIDDVDSTVSDSCVTDANGICSSLLPASPVGGEENYKVQVTKVGGYTTAETFRAGDTYNSQVITTPDPAHATIFDGQITEMSFSIDRVSTMTIHTKSATNLNYYVRTSGDDANNGLTRASAFATIQKAASVLQPGDAVYVGAGTYQETVTPANSGTIGNAISYIADTGGLATGDAGAVILDGFVDGGSGDLCYAFDLSAGRDYLIIDGFEATRYRQCSSSEGTFYFTGGSDNNVYRNLIAHDTRRDGIYITGSNNVLENCLVYNVGDDGLSIGNSNNIVRNCTFAGQIGIDTGSGGTGGHAVEMGDGDNTNIFENNIFDGDLGWPGTSWMDQIWNYNDWTQGVLVGIGNINIDPLFVNAGANDFHLSQVAAGQGADSPALDTGSNLASNVGLDDQTTRTDGVPDAGQVDMGYHYIVTHPPDPGPPPGIVVSNLTFHLQGQKEVGQDAGSSPILKYSQDSTTDGAGNITLGDLEWDIYTFSINPAGGLDLHFVYPENPLSIAPNESKDITLYIESQNSLLVQAEDSVTGDPVFAADIRLFKTGYDQTQPTDSNGQTLFIPLDIATYSIEATATGYDPFSGNAVVNGDSTITIQMVQNPT